MKKKLMFVLLIFSLSILVGCDRVKNDPKGDEMARFNAWIDMNGLSSYSTPSGLYYINEREGTGDFPNDSDIIVFSYVVRNLDDYIYLNNYKDTAVLYDIYGLNKPTTHFAPTAEQFLSNKIKPKGLIEGLSKMKEGGKARLIMPSSLAFGANGNGQIPQYTSLIYDIELVRVFHGNFEEYEKDIIDKYINENNTPPFESINDSLYYKTIDTGVSDTRPDSLVRVYYVGRFLDGFIFDTNIKSVAIDSNIYDPTSTSKYNYLEFVLDAKKDNPKPGFQFAVKHMTEGETKRFVIPSKLMYGYIGSTGTTPIPPNTPLIFEIELLYLKNKKVSK